MKYKHYLAVSAVALAVSSNTSWSSADPWEEFGLTEEQYKQQMNVFSDYKKQNEQEEMEKILALIAQQEKEEENQLPQPSSSNNASPHQVDNEKRESPVSSSHPNAVEKDERDATTLRDYAKSVQISRSAIRDTVGQFSQSLKDWLQDNKNSLPCYKREPICFSLFLQFLNTKTGKVDRKVLVSDSTGYLMNSAKDVFTPENMKTIKELTLRSLEEEFAGAEPFLQSAYDTYRHALDNPSYNSDENLRSIIKKMNDYVTRKPKNLDDFSKRFYQGVSFSEKDFIVIDTTPTKPILSGFFLQNVNNAKGYLSWMEKEVNKIRSKSNIASETVMPYGQQAQDDKFSIAAIVKDVSHIFPELAKSNKSDKELENMIIEFFKGDDDTMSGARQALNYISKYHGDSSHLKVEKQSPRYYFMDALRWVHGIKMTYGNETVLDISSAHRVVEQGQKCGKGLLGRTLIIYKEILHFLLGKAAQQYNLS